MEHDTKAVCVLRHWDGKTAGLETFAVRDIYQDLLHVRMDAAQHGQVLGGELWRKDSSWHAPDAPHQVASGRGHLL